MLDIYMVVLLAGMFGAFYCFIRWCDSTVEEGGERES